jgi:hypothetical protein
MNMKQTVQERAKEMCEAWGMEDNHGYSVKDTFQVGFVQGANWQAEQSPWISVKERLPESNITVLTKGAYGYLICFLSNLGEWETGANINEERLGITHWMPIPSFDEILEANKDKLETK